MKTSEPQAQVKFIQDKDAYLASVREVFNNTLEGILIADYKGKLYGCNKTAEQMFGYSAKELGRLHIQQLIAKDLKQDGHLRNDELFILPDIRNIEHNSRFAGIRKNGSTFYISIRISNFSTKQSIYTILFLESSEKIDFKNRELLEKNSEIQQLKEDLKTFRITAEKQCKRRTIMLEETIDALMSTRNQLKVSLEKEQVERDRKTKFAYMLSHEFKTPLTGILTSLSLLEKYGSNGHTLSKEQNQCVIRAKRSANHLAALTNDMLTMAGMNGGNGSLKIEKISLKSLIQELIDWWSLQLSVEKSIHCYIHKKMYVEANEDLVIQILNNLINNAVKYSGPDASISINGEEDESWCVITVEDNGRGIPQEELEKLTDGFFRASNATDVNGSGLGLYIVNQYLQFLNGKLELDSKLDEGTRATIRLPKKYEEKSVIDR
jgi:PAS domain S-box-containing protein